MTSLCNRRAGAGVFDLKGIGKSPARLDMKKLESVAGWHIARKADADLMAEIARYLALTGQPPLSQVQHRSGCRLRCIASRIGQIPAPTCWKKPSLHWLSQHPSSPIEKAAAHLDADIPWYTE